MTTPCRHPKCTPNPQPTWGGTLLCGLHQRGLQADVDDIARVLALVECHHDELATVAGVGGGGKPGSRPPMRLSVLDVVTGQTAERIVGWAKDILRTDRRMTVPEAACILAANIDALCCHPMLSDAEHGPAVELHSAANACRAVIPDDRWNTQEQDDRPRPVGRCTQPSPDDPTTRCGGPTYWLTATLVVRCERCRHEQQPDGWVAKRAVLRAFGLSRWTLNRAIAAGTVSATPAGLVCVDDVRTMVRAMRRHATQTEGA